MYEHRGVIITSSGLMFSPYHCDMERYPIPKQSAKDIAKAKNEAYAKDQQRQRAKHFSRSKFR